jgi:magnesium transporter
MEDYIDNEENYAADLSPVVDPAGETPVSITLVRYNQFGIEEHANVSPADSQTYLSDKAFTWIHVQGQPKPSTMMELGKLYNLHPLALEDAINLGERSKTETYENQIVVILGMPTKKGNKIITEQVSMFLGENFLVSFNNGEQDPFRAVRRRLHHPSKHQRNCSAY